MTVFRVKATGGSEAGLVKRDEIERAVAVLADPESGIQIQSLPGARHTTCPGNDPAAIAQAAEELAGGARGVYWTLHPCSVNLAAAQSNKTALRRRWLLIDADPVRPADSNSTDEEHERAGLVVCVVMDDLAALGWPLPVVIDSGNGWHLLYRIDLPNDDDAKVLVKSVLNALAERYKDGQVEIDKKVYDARRISKLPGTLTRKGPATPDRPHRWARLVHVPDTVEIVPVALLSAYVASANHEANGHAATPLPWAASPFVGRATAGPDRRRAYALRALALEEAKLIVATVGNRNDQLNRSAFALGQLVGAKALQRADVESRLAQAAWKIGLPDDEARKTIRSGLDAGEKVPRDLAFLDEPPRAAAVDGKTAAPNRGVTSLVVHVMSDLMATTFPPPRWAVPGLLSEGLSILAGKPKLGKSWLALNLALTIAAGGKALGDMQTVAGDVLYLSLEDRLRRIQDRARKVLCGLKVAANGRLAIAVECLRQDKGGLWQIEEWLDAADSPRLVIIDVWAKFRTQTTGRRNAYDEDYEAASEVKKVIDRHSCSLLLVHHCKKGKADDVIEEVSGTLGLAGSADGTMVLARSRGENEAVLHITGRDVDEQQLALTFDPATCCWTSEGDAKLRTSSKIRQKILSAFKVNPGAKYMPSQIAEVIECDGDTVRKELWRMANEGILAKVGYAYRWPIDEIPL